MRRFRYSPIFAAALTAACLIPVSALADNGDRKAQAKQPAHQAANPPKSPVERLSKMTPKQREAALAKLPPERQEQLKKRLEMYDRMSPDEKQRLNDQYEIFRQLPPERQESMRRLFRRFNNMPDERKPMLQQEFRNLRTMKESERVARLKSDDFRARFSVPERRLLQEMATTVAGPQ